MPTSISRPLRSLAWRASSPARRQWRVASGAPRKLVAARRRVKAQRCSNAASESYVFGAWRQRLASYHSRQFISFTLRAHRVSMQTQAEALSGQLAVERVHLLRFPAQESAEFAAYLRARGVRREIADAVVSDVAASAGGVDSALDIHAVRASCSAIYACVPHSAPSRACISAFRARHRPGGARERKRICCGFIRRVCCGRRRSSGARA